VQLAVALAALVLALPALGAVGVDLLGLLGDDDRPRLRGAHRSMTLYAEELEPFDRRPTRLGLRHRARRGHHPGAADRDGRGRVPGRHAGQQRPEDTLRELRDDPRHRLGRPSMPLGVSLHVHGVKYTASSDGTFETGSHVPPGESRTSLWYAAPQTVKGSS
jgi:manganese oxidase